MKRFIQRHRDDLQRLIDSIRAGIFISDGSGNVLILNDETERTGGMSRELLTGRNVRELVKIGYMGESATIKVMESGQEEGFVQELGTGEKIYVRGIPVYNGDKLELVVCTELDITEIEALRRMLKAKESEAQKYLSELEYLRSRRNPASDNIITKSNEMRNVINLATRIAKLDTTVFLRGESGTGKELLANLIHERSHRKDAPFIKINCAAIPENLIESELFGYERGAFSGAERTGKTGLFELADSGTIFLDEISEMNTSTQAKLLRVLQEREILRVGGKEQIPVDIRVIVASNKNIETAVMEGGFRNDLYYRLNVVSIELPALRNRKEDISELSKHFVDLFNKEYNLSKVLLPEAIRRLEEYEWPGNVRELRNIIERIMIYYDGSEVTNFQVASQINHQDMLRGGTPTEYYSGSFRDQIETFESNVFRSMMREYENASRIAEALDLDKSTVSRKLRKYGIEKGANTHK